MYAGNRIGRAMSPAEPEDDAMPMFPFVTTARGLTFAHPQTRAASISKRAGTTRAARAVRASCQVRCGSLAPGWRYDPLTINVGQMVHFCQHDHELDDLRTPFRIIGSNGSRTIEWWNPQHNVEDRLLAVAYLRDRWFGPAIVQMRTSRAHEAGPTALRWVRGHLLCDRRVFDRLMLECSQQYPAGFAQFWAKLRRARWLGGPDGDAGATTVS